MADSAVKHTPGPWFVEDGAGLYVRPADDNAPIICDLCDQDDAEDASCYGTELHNARLIAAAPDLLAELKHLVRLLEPLEKSGALNVPGLATLNGALAAIAKAEGR